MTSSTSGPPRKHHFVTQSWIKRFVADDGKLYVYNWEKDHVRESSSKPIMMIYDLYTVEPGGVLDTSTESGTLGQLDDAIPRILARLDGGERGEDLRRDLAWYFAAQAMRDPEVIASYAPRSQAYALAFVDALSATSYANFMAGLWDAFPGADVTQAEFDEMRQRGKAGLEAEIQHAIDVFGAEGGTALSPFTDLLNDSSGRKKIEDQLLVLDWTLKTVADDGRFVLGDHGLLFDKGGLAAGLRVPLSPTEALCMTPPSKPSPGIADADVKAWEVGRLNAESAARARQWLVGEPSELERYKRQVRGSKLSKA